MPLRAAAWVAFSLTLVLLITGCAIREPRPEGAWLTERQAWFSAHPEWSVRGRLGLSDGERGGGQWRLEVSPGGSTLTGSDIGRGQGPDPDSLVERAVGWPIPVRWMSEWLRGLPAPPAAPTRYAEDGVLEALEWSGWRLDFARWNQLDGDGVLLPARVTAENPPYRLRAALSGWRFALDGTPANL